MTTVLFKTISIFLKNLLLRLFRKIDSSDRGFLIVLFTYFTVLLLIPSNKLFFAFSFVFVGFLVFSLKSLPKAIFLAYLPLSIIGIGQQYSFLVIPAEALITTLYPQGRFLFFVLQPSHIIGILLLLYVLFSVLKTCYMYVRQKSLKSALFPPKLSAILFFLLLHILLSVVSSGYSQFLPNLSLLYMFSSWISICWILVGFLIIQQESGLKNKGKLLRQLFYVVVTCALFLSSITIVQFLTRSTLGLAIEVRDDVPVFGLGADENPLQFRPIGLSAHANNNANILVAYLIKSILLYMIIKYKKVSFPVTFNLIMIYIFLVSLAIFLTQSRAGYLSYMLVIIPFFFTNKDRIADYVKRVNRIVKIHRAIKYVLYVSIALVSSITFDRLLHSMQSFTSSGGLTTRQSLQTETIALLQSHLILGVGTGMAIPALFSFNPSGIISYFPESVHNGFLLTLVENGVAGFCLIIIAHLLVVSELLRLLKKQNYKDLSLLSLFSLISLYTFMFFHPIVNFITPAFLIFMIVLSEQEIERYDK
jgi:O-antigen ligase